MYKCKGWVLEVSDNSYNLFAVILYECKYCKENLFLFFEKHNYWFFYP